MKEKINGAGSFLKTFAITLVCMFLLTKYVVSINIVRGESMYPTYKDGDYGLSLIIGKENIKRFDVVVLDVSDKGTEKYIIKRYVQDID